MITAKVTLTEALKSHRQFIAETGSGHHVILDDAAGATGAKPIELVAIALAGCTAFDVVTILRQKHHQKLTGYEVRVEADQARTPSSGFHRDPPAPRVDWIRDRQSRRRAGDSTLRGEILLGRRDAEGTGFNKN